MTARDEPQTRPDGLIRWVPAVLSLAAASYLVATAAVLVANGNIGWGFYVGALNLLPGVLDVIVRRPPRSTYKFVFWVDVALCVFAIVTILYIAALVILGPVTAALGLAWRLATKLERPETSETPATTDPNHRAV